MTIIRTKNGDIYDLDELGIRTRFFNVESPNYVNNLEEVPGRTGLVDYGSDFGTRKIEVGFRIIAVDQTDFPLYRNEIFNILTSQDSFYISESRWKSVQWLVRVEAPFSIDKRNLHGYFSINFISITGFSESTYTTLELHDTGYSATAEKYGLVDNIDDEKVQYRFNQDVKSNFIPNSDTSKVSNMASWSPRDTNVTMNSSIQNASWYLLQVQDSGTYIATESDPIVFDLIAGEKYTLTYFAQPGASVTAMDYNWLIRSGQPNVELPSPEVTLNYGIRTGTTYYHKYDITFTAEFSGKCSVIIGGNLPTGSNSFIYFSYPRLYKGTESKSWSEVIPDGGTTSFTVYNAGNVTVEPESMYLNIGMRYVTTSGGFKIRNETTGEEHIINSAHDRRHLRLNGMVATSGTNNNFRNTNRRFISLAPGDNEFIVSGGTFEEIEIDFKYLYK